MSAPMPQQYQQAPPQYQQPMQQSYQQPYQQQPFGPGAVAPFPYGQPFPPPRKSRAPMVVGLIAVVAAVAALVTVLVVAPWKSTTPQEVAEEFNFTGVTVTVRLPVGWSAVMDSDKGTPMVRIYHAGDDRQLSQLREAMASMSTSGTEAPVHAVALFPGSCMAGSTADSWATKNQDNSSANHAERWLYASTKFDDRRCLNLSGADVAADSTAAGRDAQTLVKQLIREDRVTAAKSV